MKTIPLIGAVLLILGVLSFVVPVPHTQDHSVKIGDSKIGVQTHSSDKIPVGASVALLGAGVLVLVLGSRKS
jgi:hypothetical protein